MAVFNCDCEDYDYDSVYETLATLRVRLLRRLGYSAQAASPPPGMADLLNEFLSSAQKFMYRKFPTLRTERFFTWTMVVGERFYAVRGNDPGCAVKLDPYKISWVGVEDLNGAWLPMYSGIPPEFYTAANFSGIPARYEIRQCIEVFPAPAEAYTLRIKGHFGLLPFAADADRTTLDSELVFLWALANAKAHYGQQDADSVAEQANAYRDMLIAGSHGTRRYVPGTVPAIAIPQPLFLPLVTP